MRVAMEVILAAAYVFKTLLKAAASLMWKKTNFSLVFCMPTL